MSVLQPLAILITMHKLYLNTMVLITPKPKPQSPLHIKRLGFVQGQVSLVRSIDPAHLTGSFDSSLDLMRDTQQ
jgi:hypothetical protein